MQSTAIGSGVAVPHARFAGIDQQFGALILLPQGVDFDSIDGAPVKIVLGVIGPHGQIRQHLQLLTAISRVLRDGHLRRQLVDALDGEQAYSLLAQAEAR